jgi:pantoate--beta-alanine ligase
MNPSATSQPLVVSTADELRRHLAQARLAGRTIGLVPTMGALHRGHLSLVAASRAACDVTVVTIFVNPTQFGPGEDFGRYPRTLETDLRLIAGEGAEVVFTPGTHSMYGVGHSTTVEVAGPAQRWEGEFRPGHFRGVATVVLKLFNLVQPDRAYFGRKDYQQSLVIRRMVADLDLPLTIEVCPTVREHDGLALSSRNVFLSPGERQRALAIFNGLQRVKQLVEQGTRDAETLVNEMRQMLSAAELSIDYVAVADRETLEPITTLTGPAVALVAARVGSTRLIDNELLG